jgi:GDP-L-fucose synthase
MSGRHILVTGGTGFLGRHLVRALERAGDRVIAAGRASCDLTQADALDAFDEPCDQIWHLAAWTQAGDFCVTHPGEQWIVNQRINTNVLSWWQRLQPQAKLIALGTSCSYSPGAPGEALTESRYLDGHPVPELEAYAMTKRMLLIGLQSVARQYGLRYLYLIPNTLYGPGYHVNGRQPHFIFDLIRKIAHAAATGEHAELWGDGYQARELVYVHDFVKAALLLSEQVENDLVNIGTGAEYTIREYAARVCRLLDCDPSLILYNESRYTGVRSKCLSIDKLKRLLPGFVAAPLEAALGETVADYQEALAHA